MVIAKHLLGSYTGVHGHAWHTRCTRAYWIVHSVHKGLHEAYTRDKGTQAYMRVHGHTQVYTRVHEGTRAYMCVHRRTRAYMGVHGRTRACCEFQSTKFCMLRLSDIPTPLNIPVPPSTVTNDDAEVGGTRGF